MQNIFITLTFAKIHIRLQLFRRF